MSAARTFDTGHSDLIHDCAFDFYGKRVATCSSDRLIKVYEAGEGGEAEGVPSATLKGHDGPVFQVAWAHPQFGTLLASCGYDKRVIVFREAAPGNWVQVYCYEGHQSSGARPPSPHARLAHPPHPPAPAPPGPPGPPLSPLPPPSVNSISWAPPEAGLHLACASSDGHVTVHSHQEGADTWAVTTLQDCPAGVTSVSWAPCQPSERGADGASTALYLATAGCDGRARVHKLRRAGGERVGGGAWAAEGAPRELVYDGAAAPGVAWLRDVAWCPSALGEAAGLPGLVLAAGGDDQLVTLWSRVGADWSSKHLPRFPSPVWRLSWNTTGSLLAVSCGDNTVTLWKEELDGQWCQVSNVPLERS